MSHWSINDEERYKKLYPLFYAVVITFYCCQEMNDLVKQAFEILKQAAFAQSLTAILSHDGDDYLLYVGDPTTCLIQTRLNLITYKDQYEENEDDTYSD